MERIEQILGYEKEVEKLNRICDFLKNTNRYIDLNIELPKGVLIVGGSGVGKTFMADALAIDCEREIFVVPVKGLSANRIKNIFKKARKSTSSVILLDDIDYLDKERDFDIFGQFILEINNCGNGEAFVIITADAKESLPSYFVDQFDFDMIIELESPRIEEACEIFKPIFDEKMVDKDFNINDFCCFAQDCSYSYVEDTYNHAMRLAVYDGSGKVTTAHLIKAGLLQMGNELATEFDPATAYHEVGHAAVDLLLGGAASCIVLLDGGGGYFAEKQRKTMTYNDRKRHYIVGVAGKACEEIFIGTSSMGSYSDLGRVSGTIEDDVKILASQGFEYFDSTELNSPAYNDSLAKKVQADLQKYYDRAKELIIQNKSLIEMLVKGLENKFYLLHSEIYNIFDSYMNMRNNPNE